MTTDAKPKAGLEDVVAATSAICYLDGDRGVLAYCGYDIHDLARGATFEEVCYLLWHGRLPTRAELGDLQSQLAAGAAAPRADPPADEAAAGVRRHGRAAHADLGARALRSATPATTRRRRNYRKAVRLTAQLASLVATYGRLQAGGGPIQPDPGARPRRELPLHADRRRGRTRCRSRAFDVALVLHADHELNASTFAARVAAATLTDIHSAIVGAIGALKGPLHGGANADVMRLLLEIGQDADARARRRCDPRPSWRARRRSPASATASTTPRIRARRTCAGCRKELGERAGNTRWFEMSQRIEAAGQGREEAQPERRLLLGVDLLHARHPDRSLHADLRGQPRLRLDRALPRAVREQPADPAAHRLHRPGVSAAVRAARADDRLGSSSSLGQPLDRNLEGPGVSRLRPRTASVAKPRAASRAIISSSPPTWISATSATSPSSPTSTTASRRWPTGSSR